MSKRANLFLIGAILIVFGVVIFFKSVRLYSFGFYRIGPVSTGGILIALLVLSVILGTQLSFIGSLLDLFLMLVPAAVGVGLVLRAAFLKKEA